MNYAIIIMFVIVVCMILFFYKEFITFKNDVYTKLDNAGINESGISKKTLEEIKKINLDCMNQVRKMTLLQNQVITNSNHFTDSDSDEDSFLASNKVEKKDEVKKQDSLYISNDQSGDTTKKEPIEITTKPVINDEIEIDTPEELVQPTNVINVDNEDSLNEITDPQDGIIFDNYNESDSDENNEDDEDDEEDEDEDNEDVDFTGPTGSNGISGGNKKYFDIRNDIGTKKCDDFTLTKLKEIAKNLELTINKKVDDKWKPLNKNELFDLIKKTVSE